MTFYATAQHRLTPFFHRHWPAIQIAIIILVGISLYSNSLHVPPVMDDSQLFGIEKVKWSKILFHGGARRFTDLSFAIGSRWHGTQASAFHAVNIAIHISAAVALYWVVSTLLRHLYDTQSDRAEHHFTERFVPFATALLFVSHPLQTQAVTYVIQRYTSMATLFYLLSVLSFIHCRRAMTSSGSSVVTYGMAALTILAGIVAFGSKQIAYTLPVMLLFIEALCFRGQLFNKRFYLTCAALLFLILGAGWFKWHESSWHDFIFDLNHATTEDQTASRTTYALTQSRAVVQYLKLLCLPVGQSLLHDFTVSRTITSPPVLASLALHMLLLSLAYRFSRAAAIPGAELLWALRRLTTLGIIWFYLTMAVESSFFPIRDLFFEHRTYLPSAGFFLAIISSFALLLQHRQKMAWLALGIVIILLGGMTIARNRVWQTPLTLWQDTVHKAPDNGLAIANLGGAYMGEHQPEKALPLYLRALTKNANFQAFHIGEALQDLQVESYRFTTGREIIFPEDGKMRTQMDRISQKNYESVTCNTQGLAYEYLGDNSVAVNYYQQSLVINPDYDKAWYNLGLLASKTGNQPQALHALSELRRLASPLADRLATAANFHAAPP
jgi:tetratricopeptide (TPR) repeat protein